MTEQPTPVSPLPASGSVLGIDVGCSPQKRSSAVCRLDWTEREVRWTIRRFRATADEREAAIASSADRPLLAAALDGPLRRGLDEIGAYRRAERLLTLGFAPRIGKPGQSNSPVGRLLNQHANLCAGALAATGALVPATRPHAIHELALAEAFPSAWLGVLIAEPERLGATRKDRSDRFYRHLAESGGLDAVLDDLLPSRTLAAAWTDVTNHDDRAALICALTALGVAAGDYAAVGDEQGWIILPPAAFIRPWARDLLATNAARCGGGVALVSPAASGAKRSPAERRAACRCGELQAVCAGEPVSASVCHCLDCQRRSGSAFAAQVRWPAQAVTVTGVSRTWTHARENGRSVDFRFCPECGGTICYVAQADPDLIAVPLGAFADPTLPPPAYSVYENRRHAWVAIQGAGIEHYD